MKMRIPVEWRLLTSLLFIRTTVTSSETQKLNDSVWINLYCKPAIILFVTNNYETIVLLITN